MQWAESELETKWEDCSNAVYIYIYISHNSIPKNVYFLAYDVRWRDCQESANAWPRLEVQNGSDELNLTPASETVETSSFYPTLRRNGGSQHSVSIIGSKEHPCRKWWLLPWFYHQRYRGFQCFKHISQRFPLGFSALPGRKTMIFLPAGLPSWHAICGQSVLNILIRRTGNDWKRLESFMILYDLYVIVVAMTISNPYR